MYMYIILRAGLHMGWGRTWDSSQKNHGKKALNEINTDKNGIRKKSTVKIIVME